MVLISKVYVDIKVLSGFFTSNIVFVHLIWRYKLQYIINAILSNCNLSRIFCRWAHWTLTESGCCCWVHLVHHDISSTYEYISTTDNIVFCINTDMYTCIKLMKRKIQNVKIHWASLFIHLAYEQSSQPCIQRF